MARSSWRTRRTPARRPAACFGARLMARCHDLLALHPFTRSRLQHSPFTRSRTLMASSKESLFQILMRQPWWVTLIVAFVAFALPPLISPPVAPFIALPFIVLCAVMAFRQWRGAAPADLHERLAALRAMDWDEFSALVSAAYRK